MIWGLACAFFFAGTSRADAAEPWPSGINGVGRISVNAGWKFTPNDHFFRQSLAGGNALLNRGIGGPQATGSFGYGALSWLEVCIDLLVGYDRFEIQGYNPIQSLTYGAMLGLRATWMDLLVPGLAPYLGIGAGPMLSNVYTGKDGETTEKLFTGFAGIAGVTYRLTHRIGINLEYRFMYGRGNWITSGVNAGGNWLSAGIVLYFPSEPDLATRMPMN